MSLTSHCHSPPCPHPEAPPGPGYQRWRSSSRVDAASVTHPKGGTGVEAMTDGLLGLRAQPQHGAPIQLLPPVPVPQRDSAPRPVLRWHSREPLLTCVTRANADIILTIPSSPALASAPSAGASAWTTPHSTRSAGVSSGPVRGQGRSGGFSCMGHLGPSGTLACSAWPLPCAISAPSAVPRMVKYSNSLSHWTHIPQSLV